MSRSALKFSQLLTLNKERVHIKDKSAALKKINKIISDGAHKLQYVIDFDKTLSKQHINGVKTTYSNVIFHKCGSIPESCKLRDEELTKKYALIEYNPNVSLEDRKKAMVQWYLDSHKNLQGIKFDRRDLDETVKQYSNYLRDRTQELFQILKAYNIPVLVFSAGLGDTIEAMLKDQGIYFDNVKIISNWLNIEDGILNGYKNINNLIHVYNKSEHSVENEYFDILKGRTNVILMGDSLPDAVMADGVRNNEIILKIGFLYEKEEESLPSYMNVFDIVLIDDQTMDVVLEIQNHISHKCHI